MGLSKQLKLDKCVPRALRSVEELTSPAYISADKAIPRKLLENCHGIAFITIYKAGIFFVGGNVGGGCVISKIQDPNAPLGYRWSAPLGVQCAGLGWGAVLGGERIDSVIIFNTPSAIRGFLSDGQVSFGGSMSLAVGPVGRDAAANIGVSQNKEIVSAYSYSIAKGLYAGISLEGTVLKVDKDNEDFYGQGVTTEMIMNGTVTPPASCGQLHLALDKLIAGQEISPVAERVDGELPPGWEEHQCPDGKTYFANKNLGLSSWERPRVVSSPPPPPARSPSLGSEPVESS
eukprot:CAMPEP_0203747608 /NCGR_PEP_ID=MMETSP0098-20131031/2699_1 /ASSEMBLY_ACC=CAM_ASM_000208 /TAXON_ID=96639 /ORGANISM=" , Strain NY0313808BC1" /LENGTH=288 /DNA_ID=CAMNT_0050636069 /DNA_START=856 /DNA_END=1722 /DNA_ORIENTATION=+